MADLSSAKFCIIAVHGSVLNKIGFGIAERANRSEELRLKKKLTTISNMEQKDEYRFRKEKYNLKSQLERLKTCQLKRRRELIKKSYSEGNSLDHISASKRFNHRRLTSTAIYEHSFRFGNVSAKENCRHDVVRFTVSSDDDVNGREDPDREDSSVKVSKVDLSGSVPKLPQISPGHSTKKHCEEDTARRDHSGYEWSGCQFGTLRRQLTEPDLCQGTVTGRRRGGQLKQRPSSAHALPRLSGSRHQREVQSVYDPAIGNAKTRCSQDQKSHEGESVGSPRHKTNCERHSSKLPPVTKAHLQASAAVTMETTRVGQVTRRQSLDSSTLSSGYKNQVMADGEGEQRLVKHPLTPRSYFKKFGVPRERSELLEILLEEREILQRRIKEFLAKQNP